MEDIDPEYFKSLLFMLENVGIAENLDLTFCYEEDQYGVISEKELIPNGSNIPVTEDNKVEYV